MQKTRMDIATVLNNMDVSSEYALKLQHDIEEQCAGVSTRHQTYMLTAIFLCLI